MAEATEEQDWKNIQVSQENYEKIMAYGNVNDSFDDIINSVLNVQLQEFYDINSLDYAIENLIGFPEYPTFESVKKEALQSLEIIQALGHDIKYQLIFYNQWKYQKEYRPNLIIFYKQIYKNLPKNTNIYINVPFCLFILPPTFPELWIKRDVQGSDLGYLNLPGWEKSLKITNEENLQEFSNVVENEYNKIE